MSHGDVNYDQGIRSYVTDDKQCPCHGGHHHFTGVDSPFNWKTKVGQYENECALTSVAAKGASHEETKSLYMDTAMYSKATQHPATREYMRHMLVTLHLVRNQSYSFRFNCNACRSVTPLLFVDSHDANMHSVAACVLRDVM